MSKLLRSPLPVTLAGLALLALAYGDRFVSVAAADTGYWVGDAIAGWVSESLEARRWLSLVVWSIAAGIAFDAVLAWTGNRIVSVASVLLWVSHPAAREVVLGPAVFPHVASVLLVVAALRARLAAWAAWRRGESPVAWEFVALGAFLLGTTVGPEALALPLLVLLTELSFHRPKGGDRSTLPLMVLWIGMGIVAASLIAGGSGIEGAPEADVRLLRWALVPVTTGGMTRIVSAGALLLGVLALAWALRAAAQKPKWIVLFGGLSLTWFLAGMLPELARLGPRGGASLLEGFGLCLLFPVLAWRILLTLIPEEPEDVAKAPVFSQRIRNVADSSEPSQGASTIFEPPPTPAGVSLPNRSELRESVETAVTAAVGAAVRAVVSNMAVPSGQHPAVLGRPPGQRYAKEWNRYEEEWSQSQQRAGGALLGQEWSDRSLERIVFRNYCYPYLHPGALVLEIGQGGGKFTRLMAPEVRRVVCLDVSRNMLMRCRADLSEFANISYVLADGRGLGTLAPGSIDFAFSYDVFVHLDQEDIFVYLQDLRRVLKPGARAVISFANLIDPLGFKKFLSEVGQHRTGRRAPGRINFLSPEIVRTMALSVGLSVTSIHVAANNRDLLAIFEHPPPDP